MIIAPTATVVDPRPVAPTLTEKVVVSLTPADKERLARVSARRGVSMAAYARQAILAALKSTR